MKNSESALVTVVRRDSTSKSTRISSGETVRLLMRSREFRMKESVVYVKGFRNLAKDMDVL